MSTILLNLEEFEGEVQALGNQLSGKSWTGNETVFYGSSTIRLWERIAQDLSPLNCVNCGFGGSTYALCNYYFDRIFEDSKAGAFVLYAGDNDVELGYSVEEISRSCESVIRKIRALNGHTQITVVSIKPSPIRAHLNSIIDDTNKGLKRMALEYDCQWLETNQSMHDYTKLERLFVDDMLHLNDNGYELWTQLFREHFKLSDV